MFESLIGAGASLLGGILGGKRQDDSAAKQLAAQKEFAQSGIQWKVADAKKAGISPYYALGASTASYSPVSVGDGGIGKGLSDASQDLSRAAKAAMPADDRDGLLRDQGKLALENQGLQNDLLRVQIAKERAQLGPPMPSLASKSLIDGQPATELVSVGGAPVKAEGLKQKPDTIPATNRIRAGLRLYTNPWFSDGQDLEDRYGDYAGGVLGALNVPADVLYTAHKYTRKADTWLHKRMRRAGNYYVRNPMMGN